MVIKVTGKKFLIEAETGKQFYPLELLACAACLLSQYENLSFEQRKVLFKHYKNIFDKFIPEKDDRHTVKMDVRSSSLAKILVNELVKIRNVLDSKESLFHVSHYNSRKFV